jgi:Na+-driven multidrug efflux pump
MLLPDGMQVLGAAIATCLSNVIAMCYFIAVYRNVSKTSILRVRMNGNYPSVQSFKEIFGVGLPAGISVFLFDLCNIVINRLASGHGDIQLAAIGIVLKAERMDAVFRFGRAIGRGRDSFLLAVIRQLVFNIPLLFLFNHLFGVQGIVWTQLIADLFTVAVSYLIYFRIRKQEGWPVTI